MSTTTNPSPWIVDTTDATFMQDAIERSKELPVVVDFWATWCQPCRMLGPILEKLAREYDGKFVLVKADGDQCPNATAQFNIEAYPTVFGLRDGEAVDYFMGLLPEKQLRAWLDRLVPNETQKAIAASRQLRESDPAAAEATLRAAAAAAGNDIAPQVELAKLLIELNRAAEAKALLQQLHDAGYEAGEVGKLLSAVDVKIAGEQAGGAEGLRAALAKEPKNLDLKLQLASALAAHSDYQAALQTALEVVQVDRAGKGQNAKQVMLGIFNLLPDDSELTHEYRRKLSAALY